MFINFIFIFFGISQNLADRVAGVFVPCVLLLAFFTLLFWWLWASYQGIPELYRQSHPERESPFLFALRFCISVVVIACPCALGLATPTAIMVGTGIGATNGILIKGGATLEAAYKIKSIIFDKTGTLTHGKPVVAHSQILVPRIDSQKVEIEYILFFFFFFILLFIFYFLFF